MGPLPMPSGKDPGKTSCLFLTLRISPPILGMFASKSSGNIFLDMRRLFFSLLQEATMRNFWLVLSGSFALVLSGCGSTTSAYVTAGEGFTEAMDSA